MKSHRQLLLERKRELLLKEQENKIPGKGFPGVGQDIKQGVKDVYPNLWEFAKNLPSEAVGIGKQAFTDPERFGQNVLGGAAQGLHGLLSTPGNIRDYLVEKDLISPETSNLRLPESWMPKEFNANEATGMQGHQPGDQLLQGLAASLPYVAGGELGTLGIPARMGARAASQGAFAAGQNENPVTASLMVPGVELPLRGAGAAYNSLRPSQNLAQAITPHELQANARAAQGTNTPLGRVVGSPTLQQIFENLTTKWPGSGSDRLLGQIGQQVEGRAQNLLEHHGQGLGPGDLNHQLKTTLENAYETQRQYKNALYEPVNQLAEQEGFGLELPTFRERAGQQLTQIENSPLMQYDADFRNLYNRVSGLTQGAESLPSILDTNMMASKLHEEGTRLKNNKNASAHDRAIGNLYLNLAERARNDVRTEMHQRGSPELNEAYEAATNNYRENFSQFLDQDVYRLTQPEVEAPTIINDIIKPGKKSDKFLRIEKIQNALPPEQRNILGTAWLRNALDKEGTLNAKQFSRLIDDLGPRQFEALFPDPAFRQQLLDYGRLRGMNEKALSRMANPMTGASLAAPAMIMGQINNVGNALSRGNYLEALMWGLGPQAGSRVVNFALTNPAVRDYVVNSILENPQRGGGNNMMSSLLAAQAGQNQEQ